MKITDTMLAEFQSLDFEIKALEKKRDAIKNACRESGSFETMAFAVEVNTTEYETMMGLTEAVQHTDKSMLEQLGLVKKCERTVVRIKRK